MSISFRNAFSLLHSRHRREKFVNILDAIRGEVGNNTIRKMSKISLTCVQANHWKEQVFTIFVATQNHVISKIKETFLSSTCLQRNLMEEKLFNKFDAKHEKGIRAGFDLELTSNMLSRALFVNSCSIEVDIVIRVPTHMLDKANNVCAWYMNTSSIMMFHFICTSPLAVSKLA
jgi:hypothetical protein